MYMFVVNLKNLNDWSLSGWEVINYTATTRNLFLKETVINLNGSVSYIFLNFGWFSFLIFPISYGLRFLNFSDIFFKNDNASLFQKNLNVFLYQNIAMVWFEFDLIKPSAFWHLFLKITNILIIHSLVVKTSFLMIENSMDHGFLWLKNLMGRFL